MAFLRRNIPFLVKSCNYRFSSDDSAARFWSILPKQWRTPRFQQPNDSLQERFAPSTESIRAIDKLDIFSTRERQKESETNDIREEEKGILDLVDGETKLRGQNASIAQYLVFNGARVKFSSIPQWIDTEENYSKLPRVDRIGNTLCGIDISYTDLDFVGIRTLENLESVTLFYAEGCVKFDDYCLDFISGNLRQLEELDLRRCPLISSHGLGVLYRLKKLRKLQLDGVKSDAELELACVLLEEHFPNLTIEGVTYRVDKNCLND